MNIVGELVEVRLPHEDNFLKVKETLTRMGVASKKDDILYQSCHILHKRGKYYIVHFKELFKLDGKPTNYTDEDKARRNTIVHLLDTWDLVEVVDPEMIDDRAPMNVLKILPFSEKEKWVLEAKYNIGKK